MLNNVRHSYFTYFRQNICSPTQRKLRGVQEVSIIMCCWLILIKNYTYADTLVVLGKYIPLHVASWNQTS